jgi:hypothetical protein
MDSSELSSAASLLHWLSMIKYIGGAMVVIGVAAELLGDWFSEPLQKRLDDARRLEIAQLTTEGQRLSKEAESAKAAIADANARTAEAQAELARFKAPRVLSAEQQGRIVDKLRVFSGTRFDGSIGPKGDVEPLFAMRFIATSLASAGWIQVPWTGSGETYTEAPLPALGLTTVSNVIVDVHPDHWAALGPAAIALADALNAEGIAAIADSKPTTIPGDLIHLRIGRKL